MTSPCLASTARLPLRQIYLQASPLRAPGCRRTEVHLMPTTDPQSAISDSADTHVLVRQLVIPHRCLTPSTDRGPIRLLASV